MRAEQYLSQLTILKNRIAAKQREAEMWRSMAQGIGGMRGDGDRVQASSKQDMMAESVAKAVDCEHEALILTRRLIDLQKRIMLQIDKISRPDYNMLLSEHYVHGLTLSQISDEWNRSYRQVKRIKAKALQEFKIIFGENID